MTQNLARSAVSAFLIYTAMLCTPSHAQQREPTANYEPCMQWWRDSLSRSQNAMNQNNGFIGAENATIERLKVRVSQIESNQKQSESSIRLANAQLSSARKVADLEQKSLETTQGFIRTQEAQLLDLSKNLPEVYQTLLQSIDLADEAIELQIVSLQKERDAELDDAKKRKLTQRIDSLAESRIIRSTLNSPETRRVMIGDYFSGKSDELKAHVSEAFGMTLEIVRVQVKINREKTIAIESIVKELKVEEGNQRLAVQAAQKTVTSYSAQVQSAEYSYNAYGRQIADTNASIQSSYRQVAALQEGGREIQQDIDAAHHWINGECFNKNSRPVPRSGGGSGGGSGS